MTHFNVHMLLLVILPTIATSLRCYNGFEAKIDGITEFTMKDTVECPPSSRYCVSGLNNMVKNVFLVGFTEMRVWACEGTKAKYTSDTMPRCKGSGWSTYYDHLRYCCEGDNCNDSTEADQNGLNEKLDMQNLRDDFKKYKL